MIEFAPNSPWPRRLRAALIGLAVLTVAVAILQAFARQWIATNGGHKNFKTRAKLKAVEVALATHHLLRREYPAESEGLHVLYQTSKAQPSFLSKAEDPTEDAWNRKFRYRMPGDHHPDSYDLWSAGEDGEDGTADDIKNW